jgi:hypothetical protein
LNPASSIRILGAVAGLENKISWPFFLNSFAIGSDRDSNPRSFEGKVVNKNFIADSFFIFIFQLFWG